MNLSRLGCGAPHFPLRAARRSSILIAVKYAAIIANWNGAGVIERCLGSVQAAARRAGEPIHILAVDDASSDDSADTIARLFPSVELLRLPQNLGYARAVNLGMAQVDAPWVFLLNNDLALQADYFERMIAARRAAESPELFTIGSKTLEWETHAPNHAGMRAAWRGGMIVQEGFDAEALVPADFVQSGSSLVDREKFLALGGLSALFHPGYWEDYDLCYQALRRGWKCLYEPRAVAYHWGKRSMRSLLGDYRLALTIKRNHLLFNWANLGDGALLARHLLGLGALALRDDDDPQTQAAPWGRAVIAALAKLPEALRERRRRAAGPAPDRKILHLSD